MLSKALFSNNSDEWSTPQDLFDELNSEFHFDLDVCATDENHKCEQYYTIKDDGLKMEWGGAQGVLQSTLFTDREVGGESLPGVEE